MLLSKLPQSQWLLEVSIYSQVHGPVPVDCSVLDVVQVQVGGSVSHYGLARIDSTVIIQPRLFPWLMQGGTKAQTKPVLCSFHIH